jgi:serine protease Do
LRSSWNEKNSQRIVKNNLQMKEKMKLISHTFKSLASGLSAIAVTSALASALLMPASVAAQMRGLPDFTELVEQVGPSVVNIRTMEKVSSRGGSSSDADEDMQELLRKFFGDRMPGGPKADPKGDPKAEKADPKTPKRKVPESKEEQPRGVGSGFILSADGLVMTNAHVVEGADEVLVTLTDKREFKAKIIGSDKRSDVALIKIEATGLPAVKIGDVNRLKVGEWVMAIGSPFGLENTVTAGIVSAKQRDTGDYLPLIQTDVAINPGNSGGPLINMRGEVVGINSQIYSRSGGFQGISFAIPIDEATRVSDQLRTTGRVSRGRIGVQIDQVSKEIAESIGLAKAQGALVRGVEAGAPAALAGVEAGDVILKFGGVAIEKSADLPRFVGNTKPGSKSTLTVFRRGSTKELSVTVGEFEDEKVSKKPAAKDTKPKVATAAQSWGLVVSDLTDAAKKEFKLKGGVKVDSVTDAAERAGLREGDVISSIANTEVNSVKDLEAVLAKTDKSKTINVLFRRGDWAQFALIKPSK